MRLTRSSAIAVYAVIHVAEAGDDHPCQSHQIADVTGVALDTLIKILQQLVRARILASARGRSGGFRLVRSPSKITLLEIVEAIEGPLGHEMPFPGLQGKRRTDQAINRTMDETSRALRRILSKTRISDLM